MTDYQSMHSLIKAAESGDLDAQHQVGACYATGDWDGPQNLMEAVNWYARAALSGHALSQYDLGFMPILGEGTNREPKKGLRWMEQSALNGNKQAARVLADIYENGLFGIEQDMERSMKWKEEG